MRTLNNLDLATVSGGVCTTTCSSHAVNWQALEYAHHDGVVQGLVLGGAAAMTAAAFSLGAVPVIAIGITAANIGYFDGYQESLETYGFYY